MRILFLDIETAPNLGWVWGLWDQNLSPKQVKESQHVLSFAAKWYGQKEMIFDSLYKSSEKLMLRRIHRLLDKADVVVHFYGRKFDIPMLNSDFIRHGMKPPSPYKQVDLKKVCADKFRFPSNKLEYVVEALGIGKKITKDVDFNLWKACMAGDPKAWATMERYNRHDTALLEPLYVKLLPWISNHPNHGAHTGRLDTCPSCGGSHYQKRGSRTVRLLTYQQYECQDCGTWFRSNKPLNAGKAKRNVGIN